MHTLMASATSQNVRPSSPPNSLNTMPTAKRPSMANRPIMKMARNMMFSETVKVTGITTIPRLGLFHHGIGKSSEPHAQFHDNRHS
jgi:hypothetical protein